MWCVKRRGRKRNVHSSAFGEACFHSPTNPSGGGHLSPAADVAGDGGVWRTPSPLPRAASPSALPPSASSSAPSLTLCSVPRTSWRGREGGEKNRAPLLHFNCTTSRGEGGGKEGE